MEHAKHSDTPPSPDALLHLFARDPAHWSDNPDLLHETLTRVDPDALAAAFADAAREMDGDDYRIHLTPGAHGTDTLGHLSRTNLATIGRLLLIEATHTSGQSPGSLETTIPALHSVAPSQMTSGDVAALADFVRTRHPDALGRTCARLASDQPALLKELTGPRLLSLALTHLAVRYVHRNH
jgi:hypothetical protein